MFQNVTFLVQKLSSEIVVKTKDCVSIVKECKGMQDEAVAYVDRSNNSYYIRQDLKYI